MSAKEVEVLSGDENNRRQLIRSFATELADIFSDFSNPTSLTVILALSVESELSEKELEEMSIKWKDLIDITGKRGGALRHIIKKLMKNNKIRKRNNGYYSLTRWGRTVARNIERIAEDIANDTQAPEEFKKLADAVQKIKIDIKRRKIIANHVNI